MEKSIKEEKNGGEGEKLGSKIRGEKLRTNELRKRVWGDTNKRWENRRRKKERTNKGMNEEIKKKGIEERKKGLERI